MGTPPESLWPPLPHRFKLGPLLAPTPPDSVAGFLDSGPVACPSAPGLRSLALEPQEALVALTRASLGQEVHALADS